MERLDFLRNIDRAVLTILGTTVFLFGVYFSGPWYLSVDTAGHPAALHYLLNDHVWVIGILHMFFGSGIVATLAWDRFASLLHWMILGACLVRLYSLIGVYNVSPVLPPTYLPHTGSVLVLGAYWLFVRYARH